METLTKGEIILVPFPYTNLTNSKLRPCLVLSDDLADDVLLAQITSQKIRADNYSVELKLQDTINGSLQIDSLVRCNMLFTAHKRLCVKKICKLKKEKYDETTQKIIELIS